MNYNEFVFASQKILKYGTADTTFLDILPRMIEYAELRIYVDFDFLATLASQATTLTANNRNVTLPSNVVVCQSLNVITPSTQTAPDSGTRNPLYRVSVDYLNAVFPSATGATLPTKYAIIGKPTIAGGTITAGSYSVLFGPFPDAAYTLEVIGTVRPSPLSPTNPTTFICDNMPELFVAASMVFGSAYQQNFGQQSDNPQMAQSWENQYQALKAITNIEELRKKAASVSWSPYIPTPPANVQRERANAAAPA